MDAVGQGHSTHHMPQLVPERGWEVKVQVYKYNYITRHDGGVELKLGAAEVESRLANSCW